MKKSTIQTLIWLAVFAVAMGYMETAVVVYLREIFYPDGFAFPLQPITSNIAIIEIIREAATIIMLAGAGILSGRTLVEKFGNFAYSFAIWDIFYYVFLKLLLNWPESFLTWDLLFLIPVPWVGPIICPLINSLTLILLALVISWFTDKNATAKLNGKEWAMLFAGTIIVIISYTIDYSAYVLQRFSLSELLDDLNREEILIIAAQYIPNNFDWWIFIVGEIFILSGILMFVIRNKKLNYF